MKIFKNLEEMKPYYNEDENIKCKSIKINRKKSVYKALDGKIVINGEKEKMIKYKYNIGQNVYYINFDYRNNFYEYFKHEPSISIEKLEIEEIVLDNKDNLIRYRAINNNQKIDEFELFETYADAKTYLLGWWAKVVDDLDKKETERNGGLTEESIEEIRKMLRGNSKEEIEE